jgi:hypothetical protein
VPGGTQDSGGSRSVFAYGTGTLYGWLFNTILLTSRFITPIRRSYNPGWACPTGLGFSAFARHY